MCHWTEHSGLGKTRSQPEMQFQTVIFAYDLSCCLPVHLCATIFTSFSPGFDYLRTAAPSKGWLILPPLPIHLTTELGLFKVQFLYQLLFPAVSHLQLAFPRDKQHQAGPGEWAAGELPGAGKLSHPTQGFIVLWFGFVDSKLLQCMCKNLVFVTCCCHLTVGKQLTKQTKNWFGICCYPSLCTEQGRKLKGRHISGEDHGHVKTRSDGRGMCIKWAGSSTHSYLGI